MPTENVPTYEVITKHVFGQDLFTEMKGILHSTNTSFSRKTTNPAKILGLHLLGGILKG